MASRAPIEMLREKAQEKLDDTTRQLGETRQIYEQAHARLRELERYQQEYQHQLTTRAQESGLQVSHLQSYQTFIEALDRVVTQYSSHVTACEHAVELAVGDWKHDHLRLNAFTTLISRAEDIARVKENRHEQKRMDEFASQMLVRKRSV